MPPLVMPWRLRNFSSVRTSTSKIALPIARTSYFASLIRQNPASGPFTAISETLRPNTAHAAIEAPMIRSFLTVSTGTLASRLLGFARDSMIAALLGAGPVADAFLAAFQLVNVIRRVLSEGALNASLVPAWLRERETAGAAAAAALAGRVLGTLSAALIIVAALIGVLMPLVMTTLAPGFAGLTTLQLAVDDARLMLPYLAFAGPATVLLALSSARGHFALTAFSPL